MAGIVLMKFRSFLLIACMAGVPLVAMFSHKIPRDWRLAAQRFARGAGFAGVEGVARGGELSRAEQPARVEEPAAPPATTPLPSQPQAAPVAAVPATRAAEEATLVHAEVERQLAALGAVAFECTRLPTSGLHRCSCRVAADPSGQLHRVFQSSNPDPLVALKNLLGQVQFWKHRLATQPATGARPTDLQAVRQ